MKRMGLLSILAAAGLIAAMGGISHAGVPADRFSRDLTWDRILLSDLNADYDETIGTGTMFNPGREEPAVDVNESEPGLSDAGESASDEAVGTGSMDEGVGPSKLEWPVGFDARPGIDGP